MPDNSEIKRCRGYTIGGRLIEHCGHCERHLPPQDKHIANAWFLQPEVRTRYVSLVRSGAGITITACSDFLSVHPRGGSDTETVAHPSRKVCGQNAWCVSLRKRAAAWMLAATAVGIAVAAAAYGTAVHAATAAPGERCPWVEPGAAPYGPDGDPVAAVRRLPIPEPHITILAASVRDDTPAEVTRITRDGIVSPRWRDVRNMNFAGGRVCWGELDTSMWPAQRSQIVRVHASGPYAVGVFPGCGNVAQMNDSYYRPGVVERWRTLLGPSDVRAEAMRRDGGGQVPEPGTLALLVLALIAAAIAQRPPPSPPGA